MIDLRQGDCLELLKDIPSGSVDLILTDPPYGTTACKWDSVIDFDLMWAELDRVIKPNGAIALFGSEPFSSALRMSNIKNYKYDWVWNKISCGNPFTAKHQPLKITENISVFNKHKYYPIMTTGKMKAKGGKAKSKLWGVDTVSYKNNQYYPKNIITESNNNNIKKHHPTQKPVALMEYLVKTYTNESETVLDFTMGSGSTGVAAVNTNRKFIGIELDKDYFAIAEQRINDAMAVT